jgi:hypothetical protein
MSKRWVYSQINNYQVAIKRHDSRAVTLVCDTTFYGKKKDKLGTVIFYDVLKGEILLWEHVETEKCEYYKKSLKQLLSLGYTINSVTIDGKRGLNTVFKEYPIQMCHFHQKQIVQRYITKTPKLQASKDLQRIMLTLTKTTEKTFKKKLQGWCSKYEDFLAEMTVNYETSEATYTHYKLRAAYTSLCSNLDYLFTYKNNKEFCTPNTTNHLDGGKFSDLKNRIRVHRGLSKLLKKKLVDYYLLNNGKNSEKPTRFCD